MFNSEGARSVLLTVVLGVLTAGSAVLSFRTLPLEPIASDFLNAQVVLLMLLLGTVVSFPSQAESPSAKLAGIYLMVGAPVALVGIEFVRTTAGPPLVLYVVPFLLAAGGSVILDTGLLARVAGVLAISLYAFAFLYTALTLAVATDVAVVILLVFATPVVYGVVQTLEIETTS